MWTLVLTAWSKVRDFVAPAIAVVAALGALLYAGRRMGKAEAQRDAAVTHIETRDRADEAAAGAARDGAIDRLRDGRF